MNKYGYGGCYFQYFYNIINKFSEIKGGDVGDHLQQ